MESSFTEILSQSAETVAPRLLGSYLTRYVNGKQLVGKIVETEAYDQHDAASHSYRGETKRTKIMFGPAGFLYVYFTYGMHYCCNVVVGQPGHGAAVLIRALEPIEGLELMEQNRQRYDPANVTNGPAKLCQALLINKELNGHDLTKQPLQLTIKPALGPDQIVQSTRIGIKQERDRPWRFYVKDNQFVSRVN